MKPDGHGFELAYTEFASIYYEYLLSQAFFMLVFKLSVF